MDMALAEAQRVDKVGEVPVGAVLVAQSGQILARAGNGPIGMCDPTAHAEILVLRAGAAAIGNYRLEGCVLVVTLEPCAMCAAALVHARISGVVYGAVDPRAGAVVSCGEYLDAPAVGHRVWHMGGVRSLQCAALLNGFFGRKRDMQKSPARMCQEKDSSCWK